MKTEIPLYVLRDWHRHLSRVLDNVSCDPSDTRTANALRMARRDVARLGRMIDNNNGNESKQKKS